METLSQRMVWALMEPVVRQTFPDETGAQRMQQVAVLLAIHALRSVSDEPVTATRIVHLFGHAESEVSRLIGRLVDRGLVHRERTTRPGFKGSVVNLTLVENDELKAIFKEMGALPKD